MYFNNVHILVYGLIGIIGLIVGKFCAWCNKRLPEKQKIFSKEFFEENKKGLEFNYVFMILTAVIYMFLLFKLGIKDTFLKNLDLIKYLFLVPMLELTFFIDLKHRIIPNRLNMTMFEIGIVFAFIYGFANINVFKDMFLGMVVGGGLFFTITLLGGLVAGIYLGASMTAEASFLAFLLAAVISIFVIVIRKFILKSTDDEIPFGPFLSLSVLMCIFMPHNIVFSTFGAFCRTLSGLIISVMM